MVDWNDDCYSILYLIYKIFLRTFFMPHNIVVVKLKRKIIEYYFISNLVIILLLLIIILNGKLLSISFERHVQTSTLCIQFIYIRIRLNWFSKSFKMYRRLETNSRRVGRVTYSASNYYFPLNFLSTNCYWISFE